MPRQSNLENSVDGEALSEGDDIPVLSDVVQAGNIAPENETNQDNLAYFLLTQYLDDLEPTIEKAVSQAVAASVEELKMDLRRELTQTLESRLDDFMISLSDKPRKRK